MDRRAWLPLSALFVFALALPACGHGHILPSREAETVPGVPTAAVSNVAGVSLTADAGEWHGKPAALPVTPLKVRIVNHSGRAVRLLYQDFALEGADDGRVFRPLPVLPLDSAQPVHPIYATDKFFVAARYRQVYPNLPPWPNELPRDETLYSRQYRAWQRGLPTREMQQLALPEGVLGDGGEVAGYLYFPDVTGSEERVSLKVELDEGDSAEAVGTAEIPFRIK